MAIDHDDAPAPKAVASAPVVAAIDHDDADAKRPAAAPAAATYGAVAAPADPPRLSPPTPAAPSGVAPPAGEDQSAYIKPRQLGAPCDVFAGPLPDWQWEQRAGEWRSYPADESIELDRYWHVFEAKKSEGLRLASLRLSKQQGVIDFEAMTCTVGSGRPRSVRRRVKETDWLNNAFFFDAFKSALGSSGVTIDSSPVDMFDFRYVQDFREMRDDGRSMSRGGQPYKLPFGWKRFAVHVKGEYDGGDNSWLREDESGWAVAYHGTQGDSLPSILSGGFRVGARQKFAKDTGAGVYCANDINVAQHYSRPKLLNNHSVQVVLQLRVKPSAIRPITDPKAHEFERKYWVINESEHIRAYGVLIRELPLRQYVPPEFVVYGRDCPGVQHVVKELEAEIAAQDAARSGR